MHVRGAHASDLRKSLRMLDRSFGLAAVDGMQISLRSFAKYVPRDVVRTLMRERRAATLGAGEMTVSVRLRPRL